MLVVYCLRGSWLIFYLKNFLLHPAFQDLPFYEDASTFSIRIHLSCASERMIFCCSTHAKIGVIEKPTLRMTQPVSTILITISNSADSWFSGTLIWLVRTQNTHWWLERRFHICSDQNRSSVVLKSEPRKAAYLKPKANTASLGPMLRPYALLY